MSDRRTHRAGSTRTEGVVAASSNTARQAVAQAAAQLIAEGMTDYRAAKQKAAKQLGFSDRDALPDNLEIEIALREHHALFAAVTQPVALRALREAGVRAMQWLGQFSPWISGPVLTGTANEFSAVELDLIGVDEKTFEMFLLNEDVVFELHGGSTTGTGGQSPPHKRRQAGAEPPIRFDITFDDAPVEITLFESHNARLTAFPKTSIRYDRAQLDEACERFGFGLSQN
jgi:hypothetical protein